MKFLPDNTLAYFNAAPQTHLHDLSALQTGVLSASTLKYKAACGQASPNDEAVSFYTLNHCASIVRKLFTANEVLPAWAQKIMTMYTDVCLTQGERLLHYTLCITVREMRHLKSHGHPTPAFWAQVEQDYGTTMKEFITVVASNGNEHTAMDKYIKDPPPVALGPYVKALSYAFHKSPGWSSQQESYGGPKWGNVMDAVVSYLHGTTSMEMLVDTGYTLAHNGGPIFNKTEVKIYSHYDGAFMTILDVQRSGQLPDLMLVTDTLGVKKTQDAIEAVALVKAHYPVDDTGKPTFKGYVDWQLVDDLRPAKEKAQTPHKYVQATHKQPAAKAKATKGKKLKVSAPVTPKAPTMTTLLGKKVKMTGEWQVYPHQTVTVYERTGE